MTQLKPKKRPIFAMDNETKIKGTSQDLKLIAKGYAKDGSIIYFEEGETKDGFPVIINQLESEKSAELFISEQKMLPVIEFLNELQYSVKNAKITFKFKKGLSWKQYTYYI